MSLAGALRANQCHDPVRPIRPALDQRQGGRVRGTGQKILARETFGVIKRKHELARRDKAPYATQGVPSPV